MQAGYVLHDRYQLKKFLSGAQTAQTWLAEDRVLKRQVEIIFFPIAPKEDGDVANIPEFISALAKMTQPNVFLILDAGWLEQIFYVVAPHYQGELLTISEKAAALSPIEILSLLKQLAQALDYIHAQGFVHREVRPDNVLVRADKQVILQDFALMTDIENTASEELIGTIAYAPPEALQGQSAGHLRDIWAFGIIVYECFAGEYPFNIMTMQELMLDIMQKEIGSVCEKRDDLPEAVDDVIKQLLHRDPQQRYQSAMAAVRDLFTGFGMAGRVI